LKSQLRTAVAVSARHLASPLVRLPAVLLTSSVKTTINNLKSLNCRHKVAAVFSLKE